MADDFVTILVPIIIAAIPCIGLIVSKKFESAGATMNKVYARIDALEKRINTNELRFERLSGRLNGMDRTGNGV